MIKIGNKYVSDYEHIKNGDFFVNRSLYQFLYDKQFIVFDHDFEIQKINQRFAEFETSTKRLRLTILPTNMCNFDCRYCCQSAPYSTMDKQTQNKVFKYIQRVLKNYKSLYISWFGGEPLIANNIIHNISSSIIAECKKEGKPYLAEITTNGYLLSVEVFEQLLKDRIYFYQITIDGNKEIHNKNRPHKTDSDSFTKIYKNLLDIKEKIKNRSFRIIIRINLTKEMSEQLNEILKQFKKDFGGDERFSFAVQPVKNWGGDKIEKNKGELVHCLSDYIFDLDKFNEQGIKLAGKKFFNFGETFCDSNLKDGFLIDTDGSLKRCSIAIYDKNVRDINTVGYISSEGEPIMNGNDVKWKRKIISESCTRCRVFPLCCCATCNLSFYIKNNKDACPLFDITQYLRLYLLNSGLKGDFNVEYN